LNDNQGGAVPFDYKVFEGIVGCIHFLLPETITRLLAFFEKCAEYCNAKKTAKFLRQLPCDGLIELLQLDDPPLAEAILSILSLVIERQCTDPDYVVEFIIPPIAGFVLERIGGDAFCLEQAAIRFVHAIVGRLNWTVLPDEAFRVFRTEVIGSMRLIYGTSLKRFLKKILMSS
jgi:hypothetical protein